MPQSDQIIDSWTLYRPLLYSVEPPSAASLIEDAARAHQCGRYIEAKAIFEDLWLHSSSAPLLAMQYADMLASQGDEHCRMTVLHEQLERYGAGSNEDDLEYRLLILMLGDAEFYAFGKIKGLLEKARACAALIRLVSLDKLGDLECRAMLLYYQVVDTCKKNSNFARRGDEIIFKHNRGNRLVELRELRESLIKRGLYSQASRFLFLELPLVNGLELKGLIDISLQLCKAMEFSKLESLWLRSAKLKRLLASIIIPNDPQWGETVLHESNVILDRMFTDLDGECPLVSMDIALENAKSVANESRKRSHDLLKLAKRAKEQGDFTKANQALIAARNAVASLWDSCKGSNAGPKALEELRYVQHTLQNLHKNETGLAFFEAAAIVDYLIYFSVLPRENATVLEVVEDFQSTHPELDIPNYQERMCDRAASAAAKLGMDEKSSRYEELHFEWLAKCSLYEKSGLFIESAMFDADFYVFNLRGRSNDALEQGKNALGLALTWAKAELDSEDLTVEQFRVIFSFLKISSELCDASELAVFLEEVQNEDLERNLFGTAKDPSPTSNFVPTMLALKDWLKLPGKLPSPKARQFTAKLIILSRLHRYRQYLTIRGFTTQQDNENINVEESMLHEIEALEHASVNENQRHPQVFRRIKATLLKSLAPGAGEKGHIQDTELKLRVADCENLYEMCNGSGDQFQTYLTLVLHARLLWQRYFHFKTVAADAGLAVLRTADALFDSVRREAFTSDAADLLISKMKLNELFQARDHIEQALLESLEAFWNNFRGIAHGDKNKAFESLIAHFDWTYRAKGRSYIDLLYLDIDLVSSVKNASERSKAVEISVGASSESMDEASHQPKKSEENSDEQKPNNLGNSGVNIRGLRTAILDMTDFSKARIDEMLRIIEDEVVIVDFVNIAYSGEAGALQAVVYRKDQIQLPLLVPNVTMRFIQAWAQRNLNKEKALNDVDSMVALQELSPLLQPLFDPKKPAQSIRPGETIVFCLTGALHEIPVHAIPVDGIPLVDIHPVSYCPSLPILYQTFKMVKTYSQETFKTPVNSIMIGPTYSAPWTDDEKAKLVITQQIEEVFGSFEADTLRHDNITAHDIESALSDRSHVHFFGHAHFDPSSPARSALLLNEAAHQDPRPGNLDAEIVTARDIFASTLHKPSLVSIIGCGTGKGKVSASDDIFGFPTAFTFAGASAVVSTLWPIDATDGAAFASEFYRVVKEQLAATSTASNTMGAEQYINLASAMQTAVKRLREREDEDNTPYRWAAFYLTGFWLFPKNLLRLHE